MLLKEGDKKNQTLGRDPRKSSMGERVRGENGDQEKERDPDIPTNQEAPGPEKNGDKTSGKNQPDRDEFREGCRGQASVDGFDRPQQKHQTWKEEGRPARRGWRVGTQITRSRKPVKELKRKEVGTLTGEPVGSNRRAVPRDEKHIGWRVRERSQKKPA